MDKQDRSFKDNLGQFSKDSVIKFINFLETPPSEDQTDAYQRWESSVEQWKEYETEMIEARKSDKYVTLVEKGIFINSLEAKDVYNGKNEQRKISFVIKKFTDIPKDELELTDADLLAYFEAHKDEKRYEQLDESAVIDFVEFTVTPTEDDINKAMALMEKAKAGFEKAANNLGYMYNKSDMKFYNDSMLFSLGDAQLVVNEDKKAFNYPMVADDAVQAADSGDVIGPFISSLVYKENKPELIAFIAKVTGYETENQAWVRHILISNNNRTDAQAKKKADSLVRIINANNNFAELVTVASDDPGSVNNGGHYKWFPKGRMVEAFENASFNGPKGKLQVVKTNYGYHIVEVIDRGLRKKPVLAPIVKVIKPGIETRRDIENKAYEFIADVQDNKADSAFFKTAINDSLTPKNTRLSIKYNFIMGYDDETAKTYVKKFAFAKDSKVGDICDPIYDPVNGNFKVAILSRITKEGTPNFEDIKEQMRSAALKEAQAKKYIALMKEGNPQNLQEIVAKMPGLQIQNATVTFNSNTIQGGGGNEPEVVGIINALSKDNVGAMLTPVKGVSGIYTIIVDEIIPAPETTDFSADKEELKTQRVSKASGATFQALKEKADVKDNRERIDIQGY